MEIEENDERNISLSNAAMARGRPKFCVNLQNKV